MAENLLNETLEKSENLLENAQGPSKDRPAHIPEKFWDPETKSIRVEALLKSYLELEKKFSGHGTQVPMDRRQALKIMGVPEMPDAYQVKCDHGLFEPDQDLNKRMHQLGFNPEQAQFVYDLAVERMIPMVQEIVAEFQAERELERLRAYFGGEDKWRDMARQILAWARRNLPAHAVEGLATTYDGILAMYNMMTQGTEVSSLGRSSGNADSDDTEKMIRDPRYWRDKDPAFIAKVTENFQRKYGQE